MTNAGYWSSFLHPLFLGGPSILIHTDVGVAAGFGVVASYFGAMCQFGWIYHSKCIQIILFNHPKKHAQQHTHFFVSRKLEPKALTNMAVFATRHDPTVRLAPKWSFCLIHPTSSKSMHTIMPILADGRHPALGIRFVIAINEMSL